MDYEFVGELRDLQQKMWNAKHFDDIQQCFSDLIDIISTNVATREELP